MLHSAGRARFAPETVPRSLIADEALAENFYGHLPINQQMRRPINGAHPAPAKPLIQSIFTFENPSNQRIDRNVRNRRISLQGGEVVGTRERTVRKLPAASGALKHEQ